MIDKDISYCTAIQVTRASNILYMVDEYDETVKNAQCMHNVGQTYNTDKHWPLSTYLLTRAKDQSRPCYGRHVGSAPE